MPPVCVTIQAGARALVFARCLSLNHHHVQRHRTYNPPWKVHVFYPFLKRLANAYSSGTSGYVIRNLSTLRVHERNNDKSAWDAAPPKHREPDEGILEHERKRKVEIKCLELQDALEEQG